MRSPGRPRPSREVQREFWRLIASGAGTEGAGARVGASAAVVFRRVRHAEGMTPVSLKEPTGRCLCFCEREEIALLGAQGCGVRAIVRCIARAASAVSRQLCRNAATRGGTSVCRAGVAQWKAQRLPPPGRMAGRQALAQERAAPERVWRQGHERGPDTGGRFHPLPAARGLSPGTAARRCPTTSASPRAPASRCSSPTSAARGSAPPTTTRAACRASISQGNRPVALEPGRPRDRRQHTQ